MEIHEALRKKLNIWENSPLFRLLESSLPNFGDQNQRTILVDMRDVGTSFEPRLRLAYDIYIGAVYQGRYEYTALLNEDKTEMVACSRASWRK